MTDSVIIGAFFILIFLKDIFPLYKTNKKAAFISSALLFALLLPMIYVFLSSDYVSPAEALNELLLPYLKTN